MQSIGYLFHICFLLGLVDLQLQLLNLGQKLLFIILDCLHISIDVLDFLDLFTQELLRIVQLSFMNLCNSHQMALELGI